LGNRRKRDHWEDPDVNGRIILIWNFRKRDWGMAWIYLAQDRDRWQALVNAGSCKRALKLRVP